MCIHVMTVLSCLKYLISIFCVSDDTEVERDVEAVVGKNSFIVFEGLTCRFVSNMKI